MSECDATKGKRNETEAKTRICKPPSEATKDVDNLIPLKKNKTLSKLVYTHEKQENNSPTGDETENRQNKRNHINKMLPFRIETDNITQKN